MKTIGLFSTIAVMVGALFATGVEAQVPANFPGFTVTTYNSNAVAPGSIFLSVTLRPGDSANQFSFVGVKPQQALTKFSDHTVTRLVNGDNWTTRQ
jgi:hypothetical protein